MQKYLFRYLGLSLDPNSAGSKPFSHEHFIRQYSVHSEHRTFWQPESKGEKIERFEHLIFGIIQMKTPIEGLDPLEKIGFRVESVHRKCRTTPYTRPSNKTCVNLEIFGYIQK